MKRNRKAFYAGVWFLVLALEGLHFPLQKAATRLLYPGLYYTAEQMEERGGLENLYGAVASQIFPVYAFAQESGGGFTADPVEESVPPEPETEMEEMIAEEWKTDTVTGTVAEEETLEHVEGPEAIEAPEPLLPPVESETYAGVVYEEALLSDFSFVKNEFYTVAPGTSIGPEVLDGAALAGMDLRMQGTNSEPQILIYHTHSQEGFVDSVEGDLSTTIVGVGAYLAELLRSEYGYHVIHNTNVYDLVDGKLDRNQAYSRALTDVEAILTRYPSIEVVIDLHRDGVDEELHLVTEVDGEQTAQIMFFNGLSYSSRNGPIAYLANPYIKENLAFSLQMKLAFEKYYPGMARRNYLNSLRYNLHVRPKSLLVEAGAQTNTLEEMKRAMRPLAKALYTVLGNGEF